MTGEHDGDHISHNKALDDLERDAERDRAELADSVEALRGRLDGSGSGLSGMVADRARGYVEDRRSAAVEGVLGRIEDHPLQTVALAAMVAYPVVRIVTKIPAPVLLLGAGVALAGRGGFGQSTTNQSDKYTERKSTPIGGAGTASVQDNERREPLATASANPSARVGTTSPSPSGSEASAGQTNADALSEVRQRATEAEDEDLTGEGARTAIRDGADRVDEAIRDAAVEAKDAIKGSAGS